LSSSKQLGLRHRGSTLDLFHARTWIHELRLVPVDFVLDAKEVFDHFNCDKDDITEFRDISGEFRHFFFSHFENSN